MAAMAYALKDIPLSNIAFVSYPASDTTLYGVGGVAPAHAGWVLEWWVGADDRWHVPTEERAVRQHLVGGAPVVETAMRIPSGDAVHRVWAVPGPGGPTVVVEVENTSPVPVALALAVWSQRGPTNVDALASGDPTARHRVIRLPVELAQVPIGPCRFTTSATS